MLDKRIYSILLDMESQLNDLSAQIRMTGTSAHRERLNRSEASIKLEAMADRIGKLSDILEKKYGREE